MCTQLNGIPFYMESLPSAKKIGALYKNIWTEADRRYDTFKSSRKSIKKLGSNYEVILGMQYGDPSISNVFKIFESKGIDRILFFQCILSSRVQPPGPFMMQSIGAMGRRCPWFFSRKRTMPTLRSFRHILHPAYINALAQRFRELKQSLHGAQIII